MSPKFVLSFLLLCFVLLGFSDAQRRQGQYRQGGKYRNLQGDGSFGTDANPPPLDGPGDCNPNNLAGNQKDRFHRG